METITAIRALGALAQETRLDAFRLLVQTGPAGLSAGRIAEALGVGAATLSFHLKELKEAGVVCCRRDGRSQVYSPDFGAINRLIGFMTRNCCAGSAQLDEGALE